MSRVALLSSEPLRSRMAGIAIRYRELARHLPSHGIEPVLVFPTPEHGEAATDLELEAEVRPFRRGALRSLLGDCVAAVGQGQLVNDLVLEVPELPTAVDLYDPWLVENLHYRESLGLDPWRNDHATWNLQLSHGDFFLCSSEEQRLFYLGFLTALGRVNPDSFAEDPELRQLIDVVPFGVPERLPEHRRWIDPEERRAVLLFGGLYDWYDPETVLRAQASLRREDTVTVFIRTPNSGDTPQRRLDELRSRLGAAAAERARIRVLDWVPYERRYDLLRDAAVLVATHRPSLETDLSLRTRFLDALVAGCPVVVTEGGTLGRLLREHRAGWLVPPSDPAALAATLDEVLEGGPAVEERIARGRELARRFHWSRVLEPLVRFCRQPRREPTKADFASSLPTRAPADSLRFRARRWWRRQWAAR